MKALVTGGAGFIGSNLVDLLLKEGHEVTIIDNLSTGFFNNINKNATFIKADITDFNSIEKYFSGVDAVFHLAALPRVQPSIDDPLPYNKVNIEGTLVVLDACKKHNVKKVIFSSSSSIYGNSTSDILSEEENKEPLSPYALQKLASEEYFKLYYKLFGINSVCLRYFNVYGNRQPKIGAYVPVVGIFMQQLKENTSLTVTGDGCQSRDFVNVLDVANANYLACKADLKGYNYFNIGSGKSYKIIDIAKKISSNIKFVEKRFEPYNTLASIQKAKDIIGWTPSIELFSWIEKNLNGE